MCLSPDKFSVLTQVTCWSCFKCLVFSGQVWCGEHYSHSFILCNYGSKIIKKYLKWQIFHSHRAGAQPKWHFQTCQKWQFRPEFFRIGHLVVNAGFAVCSHQCLWVAATVQLLLETKWFTIVPLQTTIYKARGVALEHYNFWWKWFSFLFLCLLDYFLLLPVCVSSLSPDAKHCRWNDKTDALPSFERLFILILPF